MICSKVIQMTVYFVLCAECDGAGPLGISKADADRVAKGKGWIQVDDNYYCPEHSPFMCERATAELLGVTREVLTKHKDEPPKTET